MQMLQTYGKFNRFLVILKFKQMFDFTSVQRCLNHILTGCPPYCLCTNRNRSEEKLKAD